MMYNVLDKKNLNTGLLMNKWYVLLLYVNMDRAIIAGQPCVQKKDIGYFLFVKCPLDTKYIYIYIFIMVIHYIYWLEWINISWWYDISIKLDRMKIESSIQKSKSTQFTPVLGLFFWTQFRLTQDGKYLIFALFGWDLQGT